MLIGFQLLPLLLAQGLEASLLLVQHHHVRQLLFVLLGEFFTMRNHILQTKTITQIKRLAGQRPHFCTWTPAWTTLAHPRPGPCYSVSAPSVYCCHLAWRAQAVDFSMWDQRRSGNHFLGIDLKTMTLLKIEPLKKKKKIGPLVSQAGFH